SSMVNPGAFKGTRKEFLAAQSTLYANAVINNHVADTVSDIQRRYFKRYPITLAHDEEPSEDWLSQVDDNAPETDLDPPSAEGLDEEALEAAQKIYDDQIKLIKLRKEQISRRLKYQHSKSLDVPSKFQGGTDDPMFVLMSNLTGCAAQKPRRKTGYHDANISGRQKVGLRTQVYKEAYEKLDEDEKAEWEAKATIQYEEALKSFEQSLTAPPSTKPEDRQRVIGGLPKVAQPILDMIADYTGWKVTLIAGGPEPADSGRLNMISMHSGTTSGLTPMNFGRSERGPYKTFLVPVFANFLKKCYTVEECRAAALPIEHESLADILNADASNWEIHSMDENAKSSMLALAPRTPASSHVPMSRPSFHPSRAPSRSPSPAPSHGPSPSPSREMQADSSNSVEGCGTTTDSSAAMDNGAEMGGTGGVDSNRMGHAVSTSVAGVGANANSLSSRVSSDDAPPLSPLWFKTALVLLCSKDLGDNWNGLLSSWIQFEGRSYYKENGILGNQGRPQFVADWIRHARSPKYRPKNVKLETGDLDAIRKPGKNGILSVLAMVFFWGLATEQEEGDGGKQAWKAAVDDVDWVLKGLLLSLDLETPADSGV
ncbi:hypothetical protein BJ912DRAFT_843261, partial [Pholiota molesta]